MVFATIYVSLGMLSGAITVWWGVREGLSRRQAVAAACAAGLVWPVAWLVAGIAQVLR